MSQSKPLAHVVRDDDGTLREHLLADHLREVGALARTFARPWRADAWAELAGVWHDLGKYARDFQAYILSANGLDAHLESVEAGGTSARVDHSSAGARHALDVCQESYEQLAVVLAIAGHHTGLGNAAEVVQSRLSTKAPRLDAARAGGCPSELLARPLPGDRRFTTSREARQLLDAEAWTRFLFSALVDADFLDTATFFDARRAAPLTEAPGLDELLRLLLAHVADLETAANPGAVLDARREVRRTLPERAALHKGAFSLTVPTGGGKTLAGMEFALRHAVAHELRRVIVAVPFTSVLEQTAAAYRRAFGDVDGIVLEHHGAFDPRRETPWTRIAAENWDAPIVVTTTVQLFQSLFSNRSSRCRKLHRIADSVLLLDEAQSLPPAMLVPTVDAIDQLVRIFGSSVVISTATQPVLAREHLGRYAQRGPRSAPIGLERVREIVDEPAKLFDRLKRVAVRWPVDANAPTPWPELADQLARERDVLAIVHLRKDAQTLCKLLDERTENASTTHLSALMCPEHRTAVLADIKARKRRGEPVRVVATQLVEAGVDLDFPVVYRALGGLDSLAQAAGRCNREGMLSGLGELRVFVAESKPPVGVPRRGLDVARDMLTPALDLFSPATFEEYFRRLYSAIDLDKEKIQSDREKLNFERVAENYKLIDDGWSAPVVVPYGSASNLVQRLETLGRPDRFILRALGRLSVQVARTDLEEWLRAGLARTIGELVTVLVSTAAYDERFGLVVDRVGMWDPSDLVA